MSKISQYILSTAEDNSPEMKSKTILSLLIVSVSTAMIWHVCYLAHLQLMKNGLPGIQKSHAGIAMFLLASFIGFPAFIFSKSPKNRLKFSILITSITAIIYFLILF
jgi:hypothetical protein